MLKMKVDDVRQKCLSDYVLNIRLS